MAASSLDGGDGSDIGYNGGGSGGGIYIESWSAKRYRHNNG